MKMLRRLFILAIIMIVVIVTAGCGGPEVKKNISHKARSRDNSNSIKIGIQSGYVPFSFRENGKFKGISYDSAKEVFKRMGVDVEFKIYAWEKVLDLTKNGELDGVIDASYSQERSNYFNYPQEPISTASIYFYALPDSDIVYDGNMESLAGKRVAVVRGYSYGKLFDDARQANLLIIDENNNLENCYLKLVNKKVDLLIAFRSEFEYQMRRTERSGDSVKMLLPAVTKGDKQYVAFSKKSNKVDAEFIKKFDLILQEMKKDGTYQKIINYYAKALKN